jgi:leucyl-tRNA synthetase
MYNHKEIEKKWQNYWHENNTFKTSNTSLKPKYYVLDMFPYPSGAGLHVGHPEWYTANDIVARYKHAKGHNVLHPMGWDAFGLPAENYAIKTGTHPRITTDQNIATFKRQIKSLGFSYDWEREIDTTDPEYFRWTQWIFLKLFEHGLAYEQDLPINYCPSCKTGLANEEVLGDFSCERCGDQVEKKKIRQWVLWITKYAERLLNDVDDLDWPEGIKDMQRNWIGKSEGCEFELKKSDDESKSIRVYTTRVDTVFGMTYCVIAPDHPDVAQFIAVENEAQCNEYISASNKQSDQDRTADDKEKTWVFTGSYVVNPYNEEQVPLWIADYVLGNYGTGAVMAVPAHDVRDFEFAKKFNLPVKCVIQSHFDETERGDNDLSDPKEVQALRGDVYFTAKDSHLINSWENNGLTFQEAIDTFMNIAEEKGFGHKKVNYKLRDWLFSRQWYWGEPIPLIHLAKEDMKALPHIRDIADATDPNMAYILKRLAQDGESTDKVTCNSGDIRELIIDGKVFSKIYDGLYGKMICDYRLPLELPEVEAYEPAGDGTSPLTKVDSFVNVKLAENLSGKRETNTMPQWGGSCWYYLRFMDVKNPDDLVWSEIEKYWGQVDSYVWGAEHAVLHLLYARFWHKFLFDIGVLSTNEPFYRLRNQGMILGMSYRNSKWKLIADDLVDEKDWKYFDNETGEELEKIPAKMSKSLKNVINPDDIVREYGADTLRMYEMYMADFKDAAPWDTSSIVGVKRFLDKFYAMMSWENPRLAKSDEEAMKTLHKTIKKIEADIENYKFNTAIAQMMILLNAGEPQDVEKNLEWKKAFVQLLHPFAPHMAEECWQQISSPVWGYEKVYFATGNTSKIERAQKLFSQLNSSAVIEKYSDIIDVEETAKTSLECALQKLEVYKEKDIDAPIAVADTSVHFENADFDFEPTKVKRTALELAGKKESDLSVEEVAELMIAYYQERAKEAGGKLNYHYVDSWAVLYPNGEVKTVEYRREYTLTDTREGELKPYFPMANLYVSKYTGKRHHESDDEDFFVEFAWQGEAFAELFGYQGDSIFFTSWPEFEQAMTVDNEVTIWVQVLWKLRGEIHISKDEDKESVLEKAKSQPSVAKWLEGKTLVKEIYVPGKIVNLVVK